jgi:uncharacterized protein YjbI with pentapeptide repeats
MALLDQPTPGRRLTQLEVDAICARHERLWHAKPGGARAVFAWADISGLSLRGRQLCDADFTGVIASDADFSGARLDNATFFGADLQNAAFVDCTLRRSDLRGACLRGANLAGADMFEADLREGAIATLKGEGGFRILEPARKASIASGASLVGANLQRSKLSGVTAVRADFTDAILKDAKLVRANLKQCSLKGADLAGADLSGADLHGADLRDAVLVNTKTLAWNVTEADLHGALTDKPAGRIEPVRALEDMLRDHALWCETDGAQGAPSSFDKADLRALKSIKGLNLTALSAKRAVFYGLDMEGVQLQGAHLEGADLRSCNLKGADLRGARLREAKLGGADLRQAHLGPLLIAEDRLLSADLTGAVLKGADLSGADLRRAILAGADLERANLVDAVTRQADFTGATLAGVRGLPLGAPVTV